MLSHVLFSKTLSQSVAIAASVVTGSLLISSAPAMASAIGVDWTFSNCFEFL